MPYKSRDDRLRYQRQWEKARRMGLDTVGNVITPAAATAVAKDDLRGAVMAGIIQELRAHRGQLVTMEQLHKRLYGHRKDGGADKATIGKMISMLRKRGFPIVRTLGYSLF